ncbi:DNA gyrase subunit A [Clostridium cellulovorans]|uniref:DNA gyrase subunit A n=1 Tax=Clostridium cellulovorans (strain ATCC 35296 / DSM 3052 / OCM 3 / 743B) TaxID=573061 RepID=D9SML3_CLOC7|nr:DNA gyrase subunit A [Clostridium cellulovorans]ADL49798.1 DNA gyrase, A subunit [Clostridium cellulovorans 743B]
MNNNEGKTLPVDISNEMKKCYIDYAMSVIVGRALPDVRDGLKPVHRRILYSMYELGITPDKPHRKCARIVGDVLGKYHPHGDSSVYDALVRLAQDFSMRYTLVDGHGNFGSVDGDGAAAMRYTEARMDKMANEMVRDINKNTVDFIPNYDGDEQEPTVIPSRFPNLLVNGSSGIAVGMATNIPPHNLTEVIDGVNLLIENPEATVLDLMTKIKGPDFPTAGIIMGKSGIREAYETGRGKVVVRANATIEEDGGRHKIIVTEIPYQVNKAKLIENIADLVKDKKIVGISDLRDESDRDGMRIVIELKRDANPNVILNQLYKHTKLQDSFGIIMLALVDNQPKVLNLKEVLVHYLNFQKEVITRRTQFELEKAEARAHILEGLKIALDNIDEVISIIRSSKSTNEAKERLQERFALSEKQSTAIVEMRLRSLTGLERQKIEDELSELMALINKLKEILANEALILNIIRDELNEIKGRFGDERRTAIEASQNDINIEDLIQEHKVVVTLTRAGYIKRIAESTYSAQKRGGKGIQAATTKEDDIVENIFVTSTHDHILFFSNFGRVYTLKGYEIPEAGRTAKGTNVINLLLLRPEEKIQAVITLSEFEKSQYLVFGTKKGIIKKTTLEDFSNIRKNGLNAVGLREDDELISVRLSSGEDQIIMVTQNGYSIRFKEEDVRPMGRTATGVKGISLRDEDNVVSMEIVDESMDILVVSENGYGKRTPIGEYKCQNRGGMGIITYKVSEKTGKVVAATMVNDEHEIMIINSADIVIRINSKEISTTGRSAMGVTLMRNNDETKVLAIAKVISDDEEIEDLQEHNEIQSLEQEAEVQEDTNNSEE